jgi:hypothetical protein
MDVVPLSCTPHCCAATHACMSPTVSTTMQHAMQCEPFHPPLPNYLPPQAGTHGQHGVLFARDEANASVLEVLRTNGVLNAEHAVSELAIPPVNVQHYIEVHIEQGPVLEGEDQPLGVVSAILGQTWLLVSGCGEGLLHVAGWRRLLAVWSCCALIRAVPLGRSHAACWYAGFAAPG